MELTQSRAAQLTALGMIIVVITQIAYITVLGDTVTRPMIWGTEVFTFLAIAVLALAALPRSSVRLAWASLALFGLFNVVQVGLGLTVFGPLGEAGDAMAPAMSAVLAFAFLMYFSGKVLVGVAAIVLGLALTKSGGGAAKAVGWIAVLTGAASFIASGAGIVHGMDMVQYAGAAGTAATLFAAISLLMLPDRAD